MNPLKQGLKPFHGLQDSLLNAASLSMNPLKQGLKHYIPCWPWRALSVFIHESIKTRVETLQSINDECVCHHVFIHESIKTRVETKIDYIHLSPLFKSLSMNPLKQGLKLVYLLVLVSKYSRLYP